MRSRCHIESFSSRRNPCSVILYVKFPLARRRPPPPVAASSITGAVVRTRSISFIFFNNRFACRIDASGAPFAVARSYSSFVVISPPCSRSALNRPAIGPEDAPYRSAPRDAVEASDIARRVAFKGDENDEGIAGTISENALAARVASARACLDALRVRYIALARRVRSNGSGDRARGALCRLRASDARRTRSESNWSRR